MVLYYFLYYSFKQTRGGLMVRKKGGNWIIQYKINSTGAFEILGSVVASNSIEALQEGIKLLAEKTPELFREQSGLALYARPGR